MLNYIDSLLDRITMYRLVLYYLIALLAIATGLSIIGVLHFNPLAIVVSSLFVTAVCWTTNQVFAYIYDIPVNVESAYITALILALIISPVRSPHNALFLAAAGGLAMASKYILAINKKHIFNPAAIAVVLTALGPRQSASWWVGNAALLPYVVVGGFLVVRKIQRGWMVISFIIATALSTTLVNFSSHNNLLYTLRLTTLHSSLFFLAFVMLTEPLTSPSTRDKQIQYGALVGLLFPPQIRIAGIYSTPELALVVGNLYSYLISSKSKLVLRLSNKSVLGDHIGDFVFDLEKPINFKPGQYMEFTLGHNRPDTRGNRRYFTLASSPTEQNLRLGVKFYDKGSSFKEALWQIDKDSKLVASQISGDFILPKDKTQKLAFIAGGIGVTPYRSIVKYMLDSGDVRDAVLLYSEKTPQNFIYKDVFDEAKSNMKFRPFYILSDIALSQSGWAGLRGSINVEMIKQQIPDFHERKFYISGPHNMVVSVKEQLLNLGLARNQIKTDFFPGYA